MYLFVPVWKWGSRDGITWLAKFSAKVLWLESEVGAGAQAPGSTARAFFPLPDAGSDCRVVLEGLEDLLEPQSPNL